MSESWWRHHIDTFFALLAFCAGHSPVTGEFPSQRPVTRSFDLRLNKRLSKQLWGWWFETPRRYLWRQRNVLLFRQCFIFVNSFNLRSNQLIFPTIKMFRKHCHSHCLRIAMTPYNHASPRSSLWTDFGSPITIHCQTPPCQTATIDSMLCALSSIANEWLYRGWFYVCIQPMRDGVTL